MELLLDTICNIFGGIILLAILVVLQTQISANRIPNQKEVSLATERLQVEHRHLSEEVLQSERQRVMLANKFSQNSSDQTDDLLEAKDQFSSALSEAKGNLEETSTQLTQMQRDLVTSEIAVDSIEKKLQANQDKIAALKQQIQTTIGQKEDVRLPHQQLDSFKSPRYYIIKDDRVYPFWEGFKDWSEESFVSESCIITQVSEGVIAVEPFSGKGYRVLGKQKVSSSFFSTLRGHRSSTHYPVFCVYANNASFSSFQKIKQAVLDKGYLYSIIGYSPEKGLLMSAGTPEVQ
ncbi:MAG: hypothetical protein DRP56_04645 [Planctomycetota bacterium]|nr:MAG: hypothetical protein DRP56_04645 [Planctomycetota bacterium]